MGPLRCSTAGTRCTPSRRTRLPARRPVRGSPSRAECGGSSESTEHPSRPRSRRRQRPAAADPTHSAQRPLQPPGAVGFPPTGSTFHVGRLTRIVSRRPVCGCVLCMTRRGCFRTVAFLDLPGDHGPLGDGLPRAGNRVQRRPVDLRGQDPGHSSRSVQLEPATRRHRRVRRGARTEQRDGVDHPGRAEDSGQRAGAGVAQVHVLHQHRLGGLGDVQPGPDGSPGFPGPAQHDGLPDVRHRTCAQVDHRAAQGVRPAGNDERLGRPDQRTAVSHPGANGPRRGDAVGVVGNRPGDLDDLQPRPGPDVDVDLDVVTAEQQRRGGDQRDPGARRRCSSITRGLIGPAAKFSRARPVPRVRRSVSRGRPWPNARWRPGSRDSRLGDSA